MNAQPSALEQALAKIAALEAALAAKPQGKLSLKVGQSGTVCLYHGARYPIALYASQWARIIPFIKSGEIEAFIADQRAAVPCLLADDKGSAA